jgi:RNA polymerase sigma factor (sigma-70 family)
MPAERISDTESELLQSESQRARALDHALASEMRHRPPAGETSSATYLRELGDQPLASGTDERALVEAAQAGDPRARERIVELFLPRIAAVARVYRGSETITRVELLQEGVVGLLRALERYDPDQGVPFWGYAGWWVRQAMQQLIAELTRPLVLSDRALRHLSQIKRAHHAYMAEHGREPTEGQLAEHSGLPETQVGELIALDRAPRSMEEPISGEAGELGVFGELIADPLGMEAYEELLDQSEIEQVRALLGSLNERERAVLRARYGLAGPEESLRDIGERLGLSGERVRQIERRALGKLRAAATRASVSERAGPSHKGLDKPPLRSIDSGERTFFRHSKGGLEWQ